MIIKSPHLQKYVYGLMKICQNEIIIHPISSNSEIKVIRKKYTCFLLLF